MKLAFTCHRTTEALGKKETYQLGDEMYPLIDGVEIVVKELRTLLRDCCCPRIRKVCNHCLAYGRFKMKRSFKLHINGNKGMFTCKDNEHPSIYINGGMSQDKLALDREFVIEVGTIIYMRKSGGNRDDVKMEFHVIAIDDNDEEIVVETDSTMADVAADKGIGVEVTTIAVVVDAKVVDNNNSTPKSLMDNTLIATPISSTPVRISSVAFALPVKQDYQYSPGLFSPGLFSVVATPSSNRTAPDPPDSTSKKSIIQKDPTGKSPKFRLQSPVPVRSPPQVNLDKESWLQENRMMNPSASKQMMDYSTTNKCKKE